MRIRIFALAAVLTPLMAWAQQSFQKLYPVNFSQVEITDAFWKGRMQAVADKTLQACILYTETKTGRIRNFEKAAVRHGKHEGIYYDDSDVYKAIEAMAYSLKTNPDQAIEQKADEWIAKIVAAQQSDGYLNTYFILTDINKRWTEMEKHEDYCAGHLIEAGIAYYNATGKKLLLEAGVKFANHIDSVFRMQNRHWIAGHQEIELALMKLYRHTRNKRYLQLAQWLLEQRGHGYGKGLYWDVWKDPGYVQDALPIKDQTEITGHAVRAMYMYAGAADVAAVVNDEAYIRAMNVIWQDVVGRNMYLTGGIGALEKNEGFGKDYDLPNETAYCETCASVGMVFWNQRMNSLSGKAEFIDVLEKSLYNGALDGLSLAGDRFFYGNPLASYGTHNRKEWFGTACCPSNIARLVTSVGDYIYAVSDNSLWINLFIGSNVSIPVGKKQLSIEMKTEMPWGGKTTVDVVAAPSVKYALKLRIPGWLKEPAPGGLYFYSADAEAKEMTVTVNGKPTDYKEEGGYAVITRNWKKGDRLDVSAPMTVQRVGSRKELTQNAGREALQYGPLVYCVEGADNDGAAWNFILPEAAHFSVSYQPERLGGINSITFNGQAIEVSADGKTVNVREKKITAIPFFNWNNRGANEMQVWLPTKFTHVRVNE